MLLILLPAVLMHMQLIQILPGQNQVQIVSLDESGVQLYEPPVNPEYQKWLDGKKPMPYSATGAADKTLLASALRGTAVAFGIVLRAIVSGGPGYAERARLQGQPAAARCFTRA